MARTKFRRKDLRRKRKRLPPPTDGWLIGELASLLSITPRAIRHYAEMRMFERPPFHGAATRYSRDVLLRLVLVRRWAHEKGASLDTIRDWLARLAPEEIEARALTQLPPKVALALGVVPVEERPVPLVFAKDIAVDRDALARELDASGWQRVIASPSLEMHVRADADDDTWRVIRDVVRHLAALRATEAAASG